MSRATVAEWQEAAMDAIADRDKWRRKARYDLMEAKKQLMEAAQQSGLRPWEIETIINDIAAGDPS